MMLHGAFLIDTDFWVVNENGELVKVDGGLGQGVFYYA